MIDKRHNAAHSGNASRKLSHELSSQQLAIPEKETEMLGVVLSAAAPVVERNAPTLAQIFQLEAELKKFPQAELPVEHNFAPGLYIRTLKIPKGTVLIGEIHAKEHIFILTKGEMIIYTEDGQQHIKAPYQAVCRPGLKRVGYALSDVVGANVHITELTDLVAIRNEFICPPEQLGLELEGQSCGQLLR